MAQRHPRGRRRWLAQLHGLRLLRRRPGWRKVVSSWFHRMHLACRGDDWPCARQCQRASGPAPRWCACPPKARRAGNGVRTRPRGATMRGAVGRQRASSGRTPSRLPQAPPSVGLHDLKRRPCAGLNPQSADTRADGDKHQQEQQQGALLFAETTWFDRPSQPMALPASDRSQNPHGHREFR